ncbi:MAG: heat-inducible transcriptional repressor HrcA [bacterium]
MALNDDKLQLTDRQRAILQAVIEEYVQTAVPVGSSSIADRPDIHASSATVRHEMSLLEELGILLQPHTSAGRVPTDLGYRYYVNNILSQYRTDKSQLNQQMREPGVEATCRLLGELTRYTALAMIPGAQEYRLQHIELAPVSDDQLLIVLVTSDRQVLHSLTTVTDRPDPARLRQLNDLLNQEFMNKLLVEITEEALTNAMLKLPNVNAAFYRSAPDLLTRSMKQNQPTGRMHLEGTTHLFEQQDFADMPRLRALMEVLNEESVFETLFNRIQPGEIQVSIGTENPHIGLEECSIVFTSYSINDGDGIGRVGILGPKRMPYQRVINTINTVVHKVEIKK